jgi:hypothetical protein
MISGVQYAAKPAVASFRNRTPVMQQF